MQRLLSITLFMPILVVVYSQEDREHQGPQTCGGHLKGPVGVIQTPNFPNPFPVPIKCRWIIEHDITNGSISIYFTQQYTTSGLTFTEYMYYDDTYKLGERKALTVTEENITRVKWLQVTSPVLVVELTLNRLEGTQLRALGLLSVFGFNVTYAVRGPTEPIGPPSCSALECRLLGHCYASHDYQEFFCSCFEGYSGADCGLGPLCPRTNMCKNGGTCRQMGPAAVGCSCAPGFTGDLCESQIAAPDCGIEECAEGCKDRSTCDCNPKSSDFSAARFETRLQVVDQPNINISQEIIKQITSYLKASNITLEDDIEILNISSLEATNNARTVFLRIWGTRKEAGQMRASLSRLAATRTRTDRLRLLNTPLHFDMHPALTLQTLIVNQKPEVWEGSEYILSCMAYGSPEIEFTWYKDGIKVNFNGTTRDIWTRTVAEDALGRRMSVLGVSEAKSPDGGRWSCAAQDAGRRRCRALRLSVLKPPDIRLVPSTLTVNKGDNVSITCLADAGRVHGALGFSWARERSLLPLAPGREVWEDLYPAGSVLKLYNIQKSGEFRCQVSSVAGTNAKGVTMWALGPTDEACPAEASHGLRWPKTAPGAHASASCPPGHSGETTRFCEPKTGQHGVKWMLPDFSGCVADSLKEIYNQFIQISYGYSWENVSHVAHQYGAVLRSLPAHPGEGTLPLQHSREMLHYLLSAAGKQQDRAESIEHLLKIYDTLLKHPDSFLDEEKIYDLQNAIVNTAGMKDHLDSRLHEFSVKSKPVREDNGAHFKLHHTLSGSEEWLLASAGVELLGRTGNASVITVSYHNLAARLPSLRRSIEFNKSSSRSGREMEYLLSSQQIQVWARGAGVDKSLQHTVSLLFTHIKNYSAVASKLACGLRTPSDPRTWTTKACEVRVPSEQTHVVCKCRGLGTYALFTIARSTLTDVEKDLRGIVKITVGLGGAMCLAAAALQLLGLVPGQNSRLPVLLKAATAGTHSAAMLALLECDTRQHKVPLERRNYIKDRSRMVRHTLVLLFTTSATQVAGVAYAQPGERRISHVAALSVAALTNGIAMLVCYVIRDDECLQFARRVLSLPSKEWQDTAAGDTSLSLYIKQGGEVESRGGVLESSSSHVSPMTSYWRAPGLESPARLQRRQSTPDSRADIVRCVEYKDSIMSPHRYTSRHVTTTRAVCDLIPNSARAPLPSHGPHPQPEYMARVCLELGVLNTPPLRHQPPAPLLTCSVDFEPYDKRFDTAKENCSICVQSNPDVSKIPSPPIKSCLKKTKSDFTSSISLPSMEVINDEPKPKSDIDQVNREWKKAYDSPETDKMLNKISNDLDFLLNRTQEQSKNVLDQIEEAPT
ncbi:uncharacterized protein LOC113240330 [Hyposmocoma kahamanoa]|uniref:uncharacterized protein LOC113240330 n=1 Tax=Hyposmocoma kahamanoa TaxID=1477025 RepID=UPI000E6D9D0F|nr:uncharacterized protein LOC113240330 [Hyposmocoma kahamanoa]